MLQYSCVGQHKLIHLCPWNGTSFPQHPVALPLLPQPNVRIRTHLRVVSQGPMQILQAKGQWLKGISSFNTLVHLGW